jgi:signal transduction histidine kinase
MEISSSGSNLSDDQLTHVCERFWRADSARAATGTHAGLGLSLCHNLVALLGGMINVKRRDDRFVVNVRFDHSDLEMLAAAEESLSATVGN